MADHDIGSDDEAASISEAARAVRPYLVQLVANPADVDEALRLALQADEDVADRIAGIFDSSDELRDWFGAFLDSGLPPEVAPVLERSTSLPGVAQPVGPTRLVCPVDSEYVYYRRIVGEVVPRCPDHNEELVEQRQA